MEAVCACFGVCVVRAALVQGATLAVVLRHRGLFWMWPTPHEPSHREWFELLDVLEVGAGVSTGTPFVGRCVIPLDVEA